MKLEKYILTKFIETSCLLFILFFFTSAINAQVPTTTTLTNNNPANLPDSDCVGCGTSIQEDCCVKYELLELNDSICLVADLVKQSCFAFGGDDGDAVDLCDASSGFIGWFVIGCDTLGKIKETTYADCTILLVTISFEYSPIRNETNLCKTNNPELDEGLIIGSNFTIAASGYVGGAKPADNTALHIISEGDECETNAVSVVNENAVTLLEVQDDGYVFTRGVVVKHNTKSGVSFEEQNLNHITAPQGASIEMAGVNGAVLIDCPTTTAADYTFDITIRHVVVNGQTPHRGEVYHLQIIFDVQASGIPFNLNVTCDDGYANSNVFGSITETVELGTNVVTGMPTIKIGDFTDRWGNNFTARNYVSTNYVVIRHGLSKLEQRFKDDFLCDNFNAHLETNPANFVNTRTDNGPINFADEPN